MYFGDFPPKARATLDGASIRVFTRFCELVGFRPKPGKSPVDNSAIPPIGIHRRLSIHRKSQSGDPPPKPPTRPPAGKARQMGPSEGMSYFEFADGGAYPGDFVLADEPIREVCENADPPALSKDASRVFMFPSYRRMGGSLSVGGNLSSWPHPTPNTTTAAPNC